jgi:hypothetical protein
LTALTDQPLARQQSARHTAGRSSIPVAARRGSNRPVVASPVAGRAAGGLRTRFAAGPHRSSRADLRRLAPHGRIPQCPPLDLRCWPPQHPLRRNAARPPADAGPD